MIAASGLPAAQPAPPVAYEVTTETLMPHLEEALRYATTREVRCLGRHELPAAFPILDHESLKGCRLGEESRDGDASLYLLSCADGNETTGSARWRPTADGLAGTLELRLGGKNMTLSQRVALRPLGNCAAPGR